MYNNAGRLPYRHRNQHDIGVTRGVGYLIRRLVDHTKRQRSFYIGATTSNPHYSINNTFAFERPC
jgi:hypothetical protein